MSTRRQFLKQGAALALIPLSSHNSDGTFRARRRIKIDERSLASSDRLAQVASW